MLRNFMLVCLIVTAAPAWAVDGAGGTSSAPNATNPAPPSLSTSDGSQGTISNQVENCPPRPPLAEGAPSAIVVQLDPDTLWRPRGSEVRFTIRNPSGPINVVKVRVCFGWSSAEDQFRNSLPLLGSPQVRSVGNETGTVEYGAMVPFLRPIPDTDWWLRRIFSSTRYIFSGLFTVPVADMVVEVTTAASPPVQVVTTTHVGVTSVIVGWLVVAFVAALIWVIMYAIARNRQIRGRNLILRIISTRDGYASLSQLQIVVWTLVVGMSAIYVMTLSGNLISISDGTLVLLGIASAAALAARVPLAGQLPPAPALPVAVAATPEWADLVIPDRSTREIDVTRLQMLAFTLITAAFVIVKVIVSYEIPTIPTNFLLLMGISNGVYVGGRKLPSQPKSGGVAPDP